MVDADQFLGGWLSFPDEQEGWARMSKSSDVPMCTHSTDQLHCRPTVLLFGPDTLIGIKRQLITHTDCSEVGTVWCCSHSSPDVEKNDKQTGVRWEQSDTVHTPSYDEQTDVIWEQSDTVHTLNSTDAGKMVNILVWDGNRMILFILFNSTDVGKMVNILVWDGNRMILFILLTQPTLGKWWTYWCEMGTEWYCSYS